MSQRIDHFAIAPDLFQPMLTQEKLFADSSLEHSLVELVKLRASQINGCAFCIHMHSQDLQAHGESAERMQLLNAWQESTLYSPRERAALAWTEALTRVETARAPDALWAEVTRLFDPREQVLLTLLISAINAWNRLAIGFAAPHPAAQEDQAA